jgi:hypothetical protein
MTREGDDLRPTIDDIGHVPVTTNKLPLARAVVFRLSGLYNEIGQPSPSPR